MERASLHISLCDYSWTPGNNQQFDGGIIKQYRNSIARKVAYFDNSLTNDPKRKIMVS